MAARGEGGPDANGAAGVRLEHGLRETAPVREGRLAPNLLTRAVDTRWVELTALLVILAVGGFFRFFRLNPAFFDDEVYSLDVAEHSVGNILRLLERSDTHPPLSYLLLHFWVQAFGTSEAAVRSMAALFGLATVLMLYLLGRALWGPAVGLVAALLLAISRFNIDYSHDNRMYSQMTFLVTASFYLFVRMRNPTWINVGLYVVTSVALLYTHLWGAFFIAAQSVVVLAYLLTDETVHRRATALRWLALQAGLVLLWSPWLVFGFRHQLATTLSDEHSAIGNLALYSRPSPHEILQALYLAAHTHEVAALFAGVVAAAVAAAVATRLRGRRGGGSVPARFTGAAMDALRLAVRDLRLVLLASWIVVPVVIAVFLSYAVTPVFLARYTVPVSLGVYLAVAVALTSLRSAAVAAVALLAIVVASGLDAKHDVDRRVDFFRPPAAYVGVHARAGDLVLYDMPGIVFDYYARNRQIVGTHIRFHQDDLAFLTLLGDRHDVVYPPIRNPEARDSVAADLQTLSRAGRTRRRIWLLLGPQFPGQLEEKTAIERLEANRGKPQLTTRVGRFDVILFARRRA